MKIEQGQGSEALTLYDRNLLMIDEAAMDSQERTLLKDWTNRSGNGALHA